MNRAKLTPVIFLLDVRTNKLTIRKELSTAGRGRSEDNGVTQAHM